MVMAVGLGSPDLALFHLLTHAFFKAALFLAAGAVIHQLHHLSDHLTRQNLPIHFDPQDMRLMGSLRKRMPWTFTVYLISAMALAGLPLFSGFLSKDAILSVGLASGIAKGQYLLPFLAFGAALLTAFYMTKQLLLVFGSKRFRLERFLRRQLRYPSAGFSDEPKLDGLAQHIHEVSWGMRVPLFLLGVGSLFFWFSLNPLDAQGSWFFAGLTEGKVQLPGHEWHGIASLLSFGLAAIGGSIAWFWHGRISLDPLRIMPPHPISDFIARHYQLDDLYRVALVRPFVRFSRFLHWLDRRFIDQTVVSLAQSQMILAHLLAFLDYWLVDGMVRLIAGLAKSLGNAAQNPKKGQIQSYLAAMVVVFLVVLIWWVLG
jgi:NADH-quinone oxidoreductase subunit L